MTLKILKRITYAYYIKCKTLTSANTSENVIAMFNYVKGQSMKTIKDQNFMLNFRIINIIIFSGNTNLNILSNAEIIYMHNTFDYCPTFFYHLF